MESVLKQQLEEAKVEEDRFDHDVVDEELMQNAKQRRKRHRNKNNDDNHDQDDDDDEDDDDFRMNLDKAEQKFRVKRKKKHLFNEAGVKFEPFSLKQEMDRGVVDRNGGMLIVNQQRNDSDEDDPWYDSIKEQQEQLMKDKMRKQVDSSESESDSDKDKNERDEPDNEVEFEVKIDPGLVLELKKKLVKYLEPKENVNQAFLRLKGTPRHNTRKKNQRKKRQKTGENQETQVEQPATSQADQQKFDELIDIATQLLKMKYNDVYIDVKENIEFEIEQDEIRIRREKAKIELEKRQKEEMNRNHNNWWYKIEYTADPDKTETHGPFTPVQMNQWKKQDFFKETDDYIIAFKLNKHIKDESIDWKFIDEIENFE